MKKKKALRIACLGVGKHATKNILNVIKDSSEFELVAIHSRSNLIDISKLYNCKFFNDENIILRDKSIDVIYISSPNSFHYPMAKKSLLKGKNVIVEKPATINFYQAQKLINIARQKNLALLEGLMYRFHNQFQQIKKIIEKKNITSIKSTFGFPHLEKNNIRYNPSLGGGALMDAGYYPISSILYLLDLHPKLKEAKHFCGKKKVDVKGDLKLLANKKIECDLNWYFGGEYKNEIQIITDKEKIIINRAFSKPSDYQTTIVFCKNNGSKITKKVPRDNHFNKMFKYFFYLCSSKIDKEEEYIRLLSLAKIIKKIKKKSIKIR